MGSDITKPVNKLLRHVGDRGIMVGVGTNQPVYVSSPAVPVRVSAHDVRVDPLQAARQLRAAVKRPPPRAAPPMPPAFPIYRWSLDALHHVLSFDNVNAPGTGWYLNPATAIGRVYKEAAYGKMCPVDRWASATDLNLYYYHSSLHTIPAVQLRKRQALGTVVLPTANVFFSARHGRRVNVDPASDRLGTIYALAP